MMKRILLSSALSIALVSPSFADNGTPVGNYNPYAESSNSYLENIQNYLLNLGSYFGFDLTTNPSKLTPPYSLELMYYQAMSQGSDATNPYFLYPGLSIVGRAAATALNAAYPSFTSSPTDFYINGYTNYSSGSNNGAQNVYGVSQYNTNSTSNISVSPLIDQKATGYQSDPTAQALQNIFYTPDTSVCEATDSNGNNAGLCPNVISQYTVMENATGTNQDNMSQYSPLTTIFSSQSYFNQLIPQLNVTNLLGPLQYSTSSSNNSDTGSPPSGSTQSMLIANSQAQQAQNFVRFATGQTTPISTPSATDLQNLGIQLSNSQDPSGQEQAAQQWAQYVAKLSTYAAQVSVAYNNLNDMMAKRMTTSSGAKNPSSQAQSEYEMATWRLLDSTKKTAWIKQMQTASPSSIQKEQLSLLAEINYQLYLNRQMQERILLTNSILLLQNAQNLSGMITLNSGTTTTTSTTGAITTTTTPSS